MKNQPRLSIFGFILALVMMGTGSAQAQRVIVTRSTVIIPSSTNSLAYTNGYWKWSPRYQRHIWVAHPRARFRVQRGYRVRI
jgi:hypothetical protein